MTAPVAFPPVATGFSSLDFRSALGAFATGVTVITTKGADHGYGMTVNAFSSLSLDPPLVLVCTRSGTAGTDEIDRNRCFAVNILAADQEPLSRFFASRDRPRGRDPFREVSHSIGVSGAPLIDGVVAHLDCHLERSYTAGDHEIFIGEVLALHVDPDAEPLLFHGGRYRLFREEAS